MGIAASVPEEVFMGHPLLTRLTAATSLTGVAEVSVYHCGVPLEEAPTHSAAASNWATRTVGVIPCELWLVP